MDLARAKVEQLLNSAFLPPHSLSALEKLDGRSFETQGKKKYEMRVLAVVTYSGDTLQCRIKLCPELHNYLVDADKTEKKARIAGWLFLEQEGSGWRFDRPLWSAEQCPLLVLGERRKKSRSP